MKAIVIKKTAFLVVIIGCILLGIMFIIGSYIRDKDTFLAASIDKQNRLRNTPSPRLVFIGGSNLIFGIDSKRIEDSLKIPVVNMGLHAGLGLGYMLNEAIDNLKPGDIVLLSPEYYLGKKGSVKLQSQLVDSNPQALNYACGGVMDYITLFFTNIQRCISGLFYKVLEIVFLKTNTDKIYLRSSFSAEGDNIAHLNEPSRYTFKPDLEIKYNYTEEITALNKFIYKAKTKKCCVYYVYPNMAKSAYLHQLKSIKEFKNIMIQNLNCTIIDNSQTIPLPDSLFFDSMYHLTGRGRKIKTDFLIERLKKENIGVNCI